MPRGEGGGGWGLGPEDGRGASRASGAVMSASRLATGVRGGAEEAGVGGTQAVRSPGPGRREPSGGARPSCAEGKQLPGVEKRILYKRGAPGAGLQKRCPI